MEWQTIIITLITTLCGGGIGALATLSSTRRKAEFEVWEQQLDEMRELLDAETNRNKELLAINREKENLLHEAQIRVAEVLQEKAEVLQAKSAVEVELATVRCNDQTCPFRQPPTALTPPPPGLTKEEFHAKRKRATRGKKENG